MEEEYLEYIGEGDWVDNKDASLKWEVYMVVKSVGLPTKDPRLGWGAYSAKTNKFVPIITMERSLKLNGKSVGIRWKLKA